jgi:hypothetical protein
MAAAAARSDSNAVPRETSAEPALSRPAPPARALGGVRYFAELTTPRLVLWCYAIWWGFVAVRYFDGSARLWLSSLGISAIIGTGLYLSTVHGGRTTTRLEPWQVVRLYLMPFCVSSFAALIKGQGFTLVFYPSLFDNLSAALGCATFVAARALARRFG